MSDHIPFGAGQTNLTVVVQMVNRSDGSKATGITIADFSFSHFRVLSDNEVSDSGGDVAVLLASLAAAHSDGGMYEASEGAYRFDVPDAAVAAGASRVSVTIWDEENDSVVPVNLRIDLTSVWDEILTGATHNITNSAGRKLRDVSSSVILTGTVPDNSSTATSIKLNGDSSDVDGAYDPATINIISGTGAGQSRSIWEYDGDDNRAFISRDWKEIPDDTSEYAIVAYAGELHVNEGVATGGGPSSITLNELASDDDGMYAEQIVFIGAGTGQDGVGLIVAYDGGTHVATMEHPWAVEPVAGSMYAILPHSVHALAEIATSVWGKDVSALSDTDLAGGMLTRLFNLSESDQHIDTAPTPWQVVKNKKGAPGTEYLRKNLLDVSGDNITNIATVIGRQTEP